MFDPSIFDNLKVAFENYVYDLDNLTQQIQITNRIDRLEMATMSRTLALEFTLTGQTDVTAQIRLDATLRDLAAEILEVSGETPGCTLRLRFDRQIYNVRLQCKQIEELMRGIWGSNLEVTQTLSFIYGKEQGVYHDQIEIVFDRKVSEEQIGDIPELLEHMLLSLVQLGRV